MADDVVITGMGIVSPIGCGEQAFWDALCSGASGAAPVDCMDTSELTRKIACQVRDPIDSEFPTSKEVGHPPSIGRASRLAIVASRHAVTSSGLALGDIEEGRLAITVGTTMGETEFIEERLWSPKSDWLSDEHMARIVAGRPGCIAGNVLADLFGSASPKGSEEGTGPGEPARAGHQPAGLPGRIAGARGSAVDRYGASATGIMARGSATDLYGACAAGNMAIASARRSLLEGRCDVALCGGSDGFSRLAFLGFMRLRVMAAEVCRPFDEKRDGLFVGEGSVMFVLERESTARARGATIRARIAGTGVRCENYHPTRPHPEGDGLSRATEEALRDAGIAPSDVDYVCAHGTGTPQNDAIEVKVMERCFPDGVSFSSIKSLTGHTMGAAAATEAACCVLSLEHQTLIPTWHLDNVLQPCSLDAIKGGPRAASVRCVVNNSAGFGGYNASVVLTTP